MRTTLDTLTLKQRRWLNAYMIHGNATKAAREAGYSSPDKAGSKLKYNPKIQDAIEILLFEQTMSRTAVLAQISAQARAEYAEFIRPIENEETGEISAIIDLKAMKAAGKMHLIKGISYTRDGQTIVTFHDAQTALITIGKYYKLWTDRTETENNHRHALDDALDQIAKRHNLPL